MDAEMERINEEMIRRMDEMIETDAEIEERVETDAETQEKQTR